MRTNLAFDRIRPPLGLKPLTVVRLTVVCVPLNESCFLKLGNCDDTNYSSGRANCLCFQTNDRISLSNNDLKSDIGFKNSG